MAEGTGRGVRSKVEAVKTLLHVGCGAARLENLPEYFHQGWAEIRLDIDPGVRPDIVADIANIEMVESESVDAVLSAHNLEHLYPHQVGPALAGFYRVLRPGGHLFLTLPDIQAVAAEVAKGRLEDPLFNSDMGPICAIDILYGHRASLEMGRGNMAHKTGFTAKSLTTKLVTAGFEVLRMESDGRYALWATAQKGAFCVPS